MIMSVVATQMQCTWNETQNLGKAENLIEKAVNRRANIVLLQELFSTITFVLNKKANIFLQRMKLRGTHILKSSLI